MASLDKQLEAAKAAVQSAETQLATATASIPQTSQQEPVVKPESEATTSVATGAASTETNANAATELAKTLADFETYKSEHEDKYDRDIRRVNDANVSGTLISFCVVATHSVHDLVGQAQER